MADGLEQFLNYAIPWGIVLLLLGGIYYKFKPAIDTMFEWFLGLFQTAKPDITTRTEIGYR